MASTVATTWRDIPLPDFKGQPGWEFTELRKFDLASFPRRPAATSSRRPSRCSRRPGLELRQVDDAWSRVETVAARRPARHAAVAGGRGARRPRRRAPRLGRDRDRRPVRRAQRGGVGGRRVRLRPAQHAARRARPAHRDPGPAGHRAELARARRPRGGRARPRSGSRSSRRPTACSTPSSSSSSGRTPTCASSRPRASTRSRGSSARQRARVGPRRAARLGRRSASAPRNGKVFQNTILDGEGATRQGHRRVRRPQPPAPGLRHDAGARGGEHARPTSRSAASSPTAPARSGAG